jgi:hypothetical protein
LDTLTEVVTSSWYTKEESPTRMAIWHAGNTISNIISGFLAAGILENMDGVANLYVQAPLTSSVQKTEAILRCDAQMLTCHT